MNPLVEMALLSEIVDQAKFAERAAGLLDDSDEPVDTWGAIQAILVSAANVSKILWPVRRQNKARGKHLRDLLGLSDDSLLSDRTIRNHFEHYDERIEEWFENNASAVYMDRRIDPFEPGPFSLPQLFHRSYNPVTKSVSFRDEAIDLSAVLAELENVRARCRSYVLS